MLIVCHVLSNILAHVLTLTGCVFTMRRIVVSANTALRCTTCIHVYCIASECYWLSVGDSPPYGRLSCRSTAHFFATSVESFGQSCEKIQTVFIWELYGKIQHMFKGGRCSPKGSHLIHWTSAVFSNAALRWTPFAYLPGSYFLSCP